MSPRSNILYRFLHKYLLFSVSIEKGIRDIQLVKQLVVVHDKRRVLCIIDVIGLSIAQSYKYSLVMRQNATTIILFGEHPF